MGKDPDGVSPGVPSCGGGGGGVRIRKSKEETLYNTDCIGLNVLKDTLLKLSVLLDWGAAYVLCFCNVTLGLMMTWDHRCL